jgi:hypothetical protein
MSMKAKVTKFINLVGNHRHAPQIRGPMAENRINGLLPQALPGAPGVGLPHQASPPTVVVPAHALYEAARNRAIHDHQLDRLFNPDYYAGQSDAS